MFDHQQQKPSADFRRAASWFAKAACLTLAGGTAFGETAPRCWDAAPGLTKGNEDFEFDSFSKRAVWQTSPIFAADGTVQSQGWVTIAPLDGNGNLVIDMRFECKECYPAPMIISLAGPEFARSGRQNFVYFTAMSEDNAAVRLARLVENDKDGWDLSFLPMSEGLIMVDAGATLNDMPPKLLYRVVDGDFRNVDAGFIANRFRDKQHGWRYDEAFPHDILLEQPKFVDIDRIASSEIYAGRFFPDSELLAHIWVTPRTFLDVLLGRISYVPAVSDLILGEVTQIFSSPGVQVKLASAPKQIPRWPVLLRAPELEGATAILSIVQSPDNQHLAVAVWRQNGAGSWGEWRQIPAESVSPDYPCLIHPEGFAVNGRSYVVVEAHRAVSCAVEDFIVLTPSVIWVASIDPDLPTDQQVRRVVSTERDPSRPSFKIDAEAVVLDGNKARIYYQDYNSLWSYLQNDATLTVCDPGL